MYTVIWNDERLEVYEKQFEDLEEAQSFIEIENLPGNVQLYYEDDVRVIRII